MQKNNIKLFVIIGSIILCCFFSTIAYSALYSTMEISGVAYARPVKDVRITDFKINDSSFSSTTSYEEFSVNTVSSKFKLNEPASLMIFDVEITNYGSLDVGILDLVGTLPEGLSYEIINYNLKDKLCDDAGKCNQMAVKTFQIKFSGTPGEYEVTLELDFREYHTVTYTDITNNNYPIEVIDGGNLNVTFTENLKKVSVLSNGTEINYYDSISSGQTITLENISSDIEFKVNLPVARLVSGKIDEFGSEVCIKDECFYIISNDGTTVTMLAKYNLNVGYRNELVSNVGYYDNSYTIQPLVMVSDDSYVMNILDEPTIEDEGVESEFNLILIENSTGIQDANSTCDSDYSSCIGVERFSSESYWYGSANIPNPKYGDSYPAYVYDENSLLYPYVNNYGNYLKGLNAPILNTRLLSYEEMQSFGCNSYSCLYEWLISTDYWLGTAVNNSQIYAVKKNYAVEAIRAYVNAYDSYLYGIRPVIEMSVEEIYVEPKAKVISGDYDTVGSEVAIGDEHFYVISSTDDTVTMLAKYNLHVGNSVDEDYNLTPLASPTGIQDSSAAGSILDEYSGRKYPAIGIVAFSNDYYWEDTYATYDELEYVYNANSNVYTYVENYKLYLEDLGLVVDEARLIKYDELLGVGCSDWSCKNAPEWVYATSYWTGDACDDAGYLFAVYQTSESMHIFDLRFNEDSSLGVRPVITVSKDYF